MEPDTSICNAGKERCAQGQGIAHHVLLLLFTAVAVAQNEAPRYEAYLGFQYAGPINSIETLGLAKL